MRLYFTYIVANKSNTVIYVGVTNNLKRRMYEHIMKLADGFTARYNITKLVYYETHETPENAIKREKSIKNLVRRKKNTLICSKNPLWNDLYTEILSG